MGGASVQDRREGGHLWNVDRRAREPSHLGCGSDAESAHLAQLFHFTAEKSDAQKEESCPELSSPI